MFFACYNQLSKYFCAIILMKVYQKVLYSKMYFHFSLQDHWSNSIVYSLIYRRILSLLEDKDEIA